MTEDKEKITQYFSSVVIRTMRKDLETLKTSGGLVSYAPEAIKREPITTPNPNQNIEIVVPTIAPAEPPAAAPLSETAPKTPLPTAAAKTNKSPVSLFITLIAVVLVLGGSAGFWLIYIKKPVSQPTPTPIISVSPSPEPTIIENNPTLILKNNLKVSTLTLTEPSLKNILLSHLEQNYQATTSLATIELTKEGGDYLTAAEFVENLAPNSLKSFKSGMASSYALVVYLPKQTDRFLGAVLSLNPGTASNTKAIMQNWETADIEQSFDLLFAQVSGQKIRRAETKFSSATFKGIEIRTIALNSPVPDLVFSYAVINDFLVLSTHATLTKTLITGLLP
jgi:hypothetical protein